MSFVIDTQIENWLRSRGVPYKYVEGIRMSDLVPGWATINQGRPDGASKDDDLVLKYAEAMDRGKAMFPAVVVAKAADGLEVLDGIQRLCAAELNGLSVFNAYLINSDNPATRASIRVCANSVLNGTSPSQDWTISRIVDILYEHHKLAPMDCSLWSGQPLRKIEAEIASREGAVWMEHNGIDVSLKPANQRGFRAAFAQILKPVERERIKRPLVKIVQAIQGLRANNDEAVGLLEECLPKKINKSLDLCEQVETLFAEVMDRPEVKARMMGKRKLHPMENVCRALAGAVTTMREAQEDGHHADKSQAVTIQNLLSEAKALARKIIPREDWGEIAYGPHRN